MLIATWILAIATAILALSGPVALFAWLSARKQDRERRQLEREAKAREDTLKDASARFVSKESASGAGVAVFIVGVLGVVAWFDSRKPKG